MKNNKLILVLLFTIGFTIQSWGQPADTPMAEMMRSDGRIYVVIAVMLTILAGLIIYLVKLDRRISKMEKEN